MLIVGPSTPYYGGMVSCVDGLYNSDLQNKFNLRLFNVNKIKKMDINGSKRRNNAIKSILFIKLLLIYIFELVKFKPALVHIHTSSFMGFYEKGVLVLISKIFKCKTILHIHGGAFKDFYIKARFKGLIKFILNSSSSVVVLSNMWFSWFGEIVDENKLTIVPNGVNVNNEKKMRVNKTNDTLKFLFLGRLVRDKGLYEVVEAVKLLEEESYKDYKIIFAGEGIEKNKLEQEILTNNQDHVIEVLGKVTGEDKNIVLSNSNVFLLPSYNEGMPISLLEAMGEGHYVIASNVGAVPEVIRNNNMGKIISPRSVASLVSAMKEVLENRDLYKKLGEGNKVFIENNYSWSKIAIIVEKLYEKLIRS